MIPKPIRKTNKELRETYYSLRCAICSVRGCDPCHIKSVGSGGHDEDWNLINLCRIHHTEQHKIGWIKLCKKYPSLELVLASKGWILKSLFGQMKLIRENHDQSID